MATESRKRWVLALSDPIAAEALVRELAAFVKPYCVFDGLQALEWIKSEMPDVLVVDLALPGLEGAALIERVRAMDLYFMPFALGLSHPGMELMEEVAYRAGVSRILHKPLTARTLLDVISTLTPLDRLARAGVTERRIRRWLWTLGFSAGARGTRYLAYAVDIMSRDARLGKRLNEVVYPLVAQRFCVTANQADHAMRRAIESAWSGGPRELQYRLFGNTIDARRGKPTLGAMIACMAELLRTGMEMEI